MEESYKLPDNLKHIKHIKGDVWFCEVHKKEFKKEYRLLKRKQYGCPQCNKDNNKGRITKDEFIERSQKLHNNKFSYDKVILNTVVEKVIITCPIHGDFTQVASSHLSGIGCRKCFFEQRCGQTSKYSKEEWIKILSDIHKNKYDYSQNEIISSQEKMKIICPLHGEFYQNPSTHKYGHGCPKCSFEQTSIRATKTREQTIKDFIKRQGNKYDYSKVDYTGAKDKVTIICKDHGEFLQTPNDHLSGYGCPACGEQRSYAEEEIHEFLEQLGYKKATDFFVNSRSIISPLELDVFFPNLNIAIEYNGLFWHSYNVPESTNEINKHLRKTIMCNEKNIQLLHFVEDEWMFKKDIVKSIISNKLGKNNLKIFGRKCEIKEISAKEFNDFCTTNHIQGIHQSSIRLALVNNNEIVSVMGFNRHHKHQWELTRFCNKLMTNVIGGASKMFKHFIETYQPNEILSFCDLRLSKGSLYGTLGFEKQYISKPNYRYILTNPISSLSRYQCQKHKLSKLLPKFDEKLSECQNMFMNGYRRIWDCGNIKFVWKKS